MKKRVVFLLLAVLLVSGCASSKTSFTEKDAPGELDNFNDQDVTKRIDEINNGATPKEKINKPAESKTNAQSSNQSKQATPTEQTNKAQLENLTDKYSQAIIKTSLGDITIAFFAKESPVTVNNFLNLAKKDFYDGTKFHRVIKDFMIQGGDPNSKDDDWSDDGAGGPGYRFQDEFNTQKLVRGSLAMANSVPNTNGSQFFIVTAPSTPWLDGKHTNFGYVVSGMDVVDKIEAVEKNGRDHPLKDIVVKDVELK